MMAENFEIMEGVIQNNEQKNEVMANASIRDCNECLRENNVAM